MKKNLLFLLLLLTSFVAAKAQVLYQDTYEQQYSGNSSYTITIPLASFDGTRNVYTSSLTSIGGFFYRVKFNADSAHPNNWVIQYNPDNNTVGPWFTGFYNATATIPNAPDLNVGTWIVEPGNFDNNSNPDVLTQLATYLPPTLTSTAASGITMVAATLGGNITSNGGAALTERGIVYAATANPTIATGTKVIISGTSIGAYSQSVPGFTTGTTYHYQAYAINSAGTSYGGDLSFTTLSAATITTNGTLTAMSTTYGTASASQSFTVSGSNMSAAVTVTPPAGFEVSNDNTTFSATTTVGSAGNFASSPVYVRLKANAAVASYSGNIVLTSTNATPVNLATVSSTVSKAPLTITANNQTKVYGAALPALTASYAGFMNGDTNANLTTQPTLSTTATASSPVAGSPYATTASGATAANYTISYVAGNLSVTTAPLTITANNQTKVYGAALPALTASFTGFVNGDTPASLTTLPTLTTTATAASSVAGSPYAITASGAVSSNYTISYGAGSLSVTAAPLTITANNQTKVYGAALPTLTASFTGFVNGDTPASLTTLPTLTTTATATSSVAGSPYSITASGAVSSNYTISYAAGSLSVTAAPLTITANNQTKVYGAALPTLTASFTGFVNGDTSASLTTLPTLTTTATATSSVAGSPYSITASGAVSSNYTISYAAGSLSVTAATLTITANNRTKVYGAALPTLTASYTGFVNGDTPASLTTPPTLTNTATATSSVAGSPYAITASGAVSSNYTISYAAGNLSVTAAPLTITANNRTKVYGAALPTLTASYTGFVNGDTPASLTTQPTLSTTATAASSVAGSPYSITASGAVDANYTISYVAGTLSVTTAALTITADNQSKDYGAALPILTASYTGFVNGDTNLSLTTQPTLSTTATAASPVTGSPYSITASGAVDANYTISYVSGTLSIGAVPLTITADNQTKVYGASLPLLTASYTGFVNGDTNASLSTQPTLSTTATAASPVAGSPYPITATGAAGANYIISYVAGTLNIGAVPLTITADNQTKAYGVSLPVLTASYTGFVNGDTNASLTTQPVLSTTATAASPVAGSPYAITATGAADANYTISYVAGTLNIGAVPLTITADNQTKAYGAAVPLLTASYTGFVNGDTNANLTTQPVLSTTATAASSVAGSPYPITATGAADANYTISYAAGTLNIGAVPLTITADNQTKDYGAALPTLTASYIGFVNGDTNASLTTQPTLSTTAIAASPVAGSPYPITATGAADANYTISYLVGTLNIGAVPLTITADNQTKAYGAALPSLTASYSGFVNGDTNASLTTQPALSTTATAASPVAGSPYPITATGAASTNYTISYIAGTLNIGAVPLTIIADNQTKAYGAALPSLTASYTGFVNGDTDASLATQPTLSTTATAASPVAGSPYPITATGAADANYTISYVAGTLNIGAVPLTITADYKTKDYGAALPLLTASYSGFVNGDTNASLSTQPTLSTTATAASPVAGSPYPITATGAADANYTISYVAGTLNIGAVPLTITADNQTKAYGAALPALTASYTGFVNGDTNASLTAQPALSTTATATSSVAGSPYPITATGAASTNYSISYVAGTLNIGTVPLTITADNKTKSYGAALPALTASYSGFVNGDTNASLTTQPALSTTATAASSVAGSPYPITAMGAVSTNYTISYVAGTLNIGAVPLTITANNQTKPYGAALPALTASYTGFVNGDTNASLTTQPALSTTATATSSVTGNPYPITATGAVSSDYAISYVAGTLSITNAVLTITADNQSKVYGSANPVLTVSYSGFVNGESASSLTTQPLLSTTATTSSAVNNYPIIVSGAAIPNYSIVYVPGTLTVNKAILTVTADNKSRNFAGLNPPLTLTYGGFVNGDTNASLTNAATATTTANLLSLPGNYPITPGGAAAANYSFNYINGTFTVVPLTLNILSNLTISSGTLSPAFSTATHSYTASVDYAVNNITFLPTFETTATIKINGLTATNGTLSSGVPLNQGNNIISVVVTAQDGLTTNAYTVTVYRGASAASVTATNILTPNGDGKNDTWVIQDIQLYPKNSVTIYDRAGRTVYSKTGYTNDWDGTLKGSPLTEGTYFYTVNLGPGLPQFKGFITILRSN